MKNETVFLQITGADIPGTISIINEMGVSVYDLEYIDLLSAKLKIPLSQYRLFEKAALQRGNRIQRLGSKGVAVILQKILFRPIFIVVSLIILALTIWLPKHILFVAVEGNQQVQAETILQQAQASGVYFGAKRSEVRSETVKNQLLENIPALQWAGVNTVGCMAVIQVREETSTLLDQQENRFSSIVASTDGIITSYTVLSGNAVCAVGDAVKKDQVLISGYQDLGMVVKLTQSKGEVYAQTKNNLHAVIPAVYLQTEMIEKEIVRYSLIIGKKRINLSKGSGISCAGCDKIYTEYFVTLPGGFVLPFSLVRERIDFRKEGLNCLGENEAESYLLKNADAYFQTHTISGNILNRSYFTQPTIEVFEMVVHYDCIEMIGRERPEEYQFEYGKDN